MHTALLATASELATTASVYMDSQPGNYIGAAMGAPEVLWVHGDQGIFSASANYDDDNTTGVDISFDNGSLWNFQFSAPTYNAATNTNNGQLLEDGVYTDAQRFPFNSPTLPGMTISGNGSGDNQDSGWFDILNIAYNPNGTLASLAVDFEQYDNATESGPGLYGSSRFNSSLPIDTIAPIPLPGTLILLLSGCLGIWLMSHRTQRE